MGSSLPDAGCHRTQDARPSSRIRALMSFTNRFGRGLSTANFKEPFDVSYGAVSSWRAASTDPLWARNSGGF